MKPPVDIVDRTTVMEVNGDTCDACPHHARVQASFYVQMPSGHTLTYCGHHGVEFWDELTRQGATVLDLRHMTEP